MVTIDAAVKFLSTPSARRATIQVTADIYTHLISIHALREEGDDLGQGNSPARGISIHALREEGDLNFVSMGPNNIKFLSTPSARRATDETGEFTPIEQISIHALREEGD